MQRIVIVAMLIEQMIKKFYKDSPSKDVRYVSDELRLSFPCSSIDIVQADLKSCIDEKGYMALNGINKWQKAVLGNQRGMFRSDKDDPEVKAPSTTRK
ncbi:unnamed protein product [Didymodactylos carnosus]|uniref:Uncharacterized protein n=1 Tax=Didymodactylos carnosus TaxID=1234261 RepID=A0A814EYY9_9BILA|nr:unnamed protein product [Didymodactylos carnosus]CAF0978766.1 unnamed protein product [Didymodactylos carnosus]CAF3645218.1 unnamed protein product [Didymodactylos carnosus]CAF3751496.1 unnamed protein product [Didymodactylos carnosus]